jgi:hypothetical protein
VVQLGAVRRRQTADKAANPVGCKSPRHQLPVFGWLAYPMHAEVTKHVLLGRKSLGCPAAVGAAVGTIGEASKLRGLNIKEYLQPRNTIRQRNRFGGKRGKPTRLTSGEGR